MGKQSVVKIKGHLYRYEYAEGETRYLGPVGDGPSLSEKEFLSHLDDDNPFEDVETLDEVKDTIFDVAFEELQANVGPDEINEWLANSFNEEEEIVADFEVGDEPGKMIQLRGEAVATLLDGIGVKFHRGDVAHPDIDFEEDYEANKDYMLKDVAEIFLESQGFYKNVYDEAIGEKEEDPEANFNEIIHDRARDNIGSYQIEALEDLFDGELDKRYLPQMREAWQKKGYFILEKEP